MWPPRRLIDLREIMSGCNRRYISYLFALYDFSAGIQALGRLTKPREVGGKTVQGINFFAPVENALLHALQNPRVNIAGIRRASCWQTSACSHRPGCRGNCCGYWTSASSNAPSEPTAITLSRPDALPPQQRNGSPRR